MLLNIYTGLAPPNEDVILNMLFVGGPVAVSEVMTSGCEIAKLRAVPGSGGAAGGVVRLAGHDEMAG